MCSIFLNDAHLAATKMFLFTGRKPTRIGGRERQGRMDYEAFFAGHLRRLHDEGRYRVFAELERIVGAFPRARLHRDGEPPRDVTVWCSNDYLAMGQHPAVVTAMHKAID